MIHHQKLLTILPTRTSYSFWTKVRASIRHNNQNYASFLTTASLLDFIRGDYPTVIRKEREGLAILGALNNPPHEIGAVHSRILLGLALIRTGHAEEGEPLLRLQTSEETLDNFYFDLTFGNREIALGECLLALKHYTEAEPLLLSGHEELQKRLGSQNLMTIRAHRLLHDLYLAWNKPEQATRYASENAAAPPAVQPTVALRRRRHAGDALCLIGPASSMPWTWLILPSTGSTTHHSRAAARRRRYEHAGRTRA